MAGGIHQQGVVVKSKILDSEFSLPMIDFFYDLFRSS